jgi:outer membrane protein assembly factor BamD
MLRVICLLCLLMVACSSDEKKTDTAETTFARAQELEKDDRLEDAIRYYNQVKTKFPYSNLAVQSELAAADTYFKQESFAEAQVAYQAFKELHPKHPQMDYVTFRLGLSFFSQLPTTIERDLGLAQSAILYFDEVLQRFPQSAHAAEATKNRTATLVMLAEKEMHIAEFYFVRKKYDSALSRFEGLLQKYPALGFDAGALSKAAISAFKNGDQDRAKKYLSELKTKFPNSSELNDAAKEVK